MGYYTRGYIYDDKGNQIGAIEGKNGRPLDDVPEDCYWVCNNTSVGPALTVIPPNGQLTPLEEELLDLFNAVRDYEYIDAYYAQHRPDELEPIDPACILEYRQQQTRVGELCRQLAGNPLLKILKIENYP
jgi:hypothetical protein